ncbi:MAG: hypothetical protein RJA36_1369 [Pseudomonadota bacterium]|jgi:hypothetical protein
MKSGWLWLLRALVALLLLAVFSLYLRPDFTRSLADLFWSCL